VLLLTFECVQATDAGLAVAAQHMPSLRVLYLSYCRQTGDTGLEHVLKMERLEELDLYNTPCVSAAAVARVARYVQLKLSGCTCTAVCVQSVCAECVADWGRCKTPQHSMCMQ
jgi:hypothetical protein